MSEQVPWYVRLILVQPERVSRGLERVRAARVVDEPPNLWQLSLGVLRMWHRVLFRSDTVGTSPGGRVRDTWRARLLKNRALRFPFLVAERAIAPLDFTGLASSRDRIVKHLLGAHHDGDQFVYDLEMLACHEGGLEALSRAVDAHIADEQSARAQWLEDLTVFDGYHASLKAAVDRAVARGVEVPATAAHDPDLSFRAYLRWCASQPSTPRETLARWWSS